MLQLPRRVWHRHRFVPAVEEAFAGLRPALSAARTGTVDLKGMGKTSLRFKAATTKEGEPQLDIELPKDWLKQGAPVLYETSLNPRR